MDVRDQRDARNAEALGDQRRGVREHVTDHDIGSERAEVVLTVEDGTPNGLVRLQVRARDRVERVLRCTRELQTLSLDVLLPAVARCAP